jgi:hypothetical protein
MFYAWIDEHPVFAIVIIGIALLLVLAKGIADHYSDPE